MEDDLRPRPRRRPRPGARMSASCSSAPPATFSRFPFERSSRTCTSSPRASSASTTCEPMNPAPPVTTARIRPRILGAWASSSRSKASTASGKGTQAARSPRPARRRGHAGRLVQLPALRRQPVQPCGRRLPERRVRRRRRGASRSSPRCSTRATASTRGRGSSPRSRSTTSSSATATSASNAAHQGAKLERRRASRACSPGSRRSSTASSRCRARTSSCCSTRRSRSRASSSAARLRARYTTLEADIHEADAEHCERDARGLPRARAAWTAGTSSRRRATTARRATSTTVAAEVWRAVEPLLA